MASSEEKNNAHSIDKSDVIDQRVQYVRVDDFREDEISLMDLAGVFIKWKSLFVGVILLVTALGAVYALNKPALYSYFVSVEIGNILDGANLENVSKLRPLEAPDALLNKINKNYIPVVSQKILKKYSGKKNMPSVTASKAKKGNIIYLESKDVLKNEGVNIEFLNALVNEVISDHRVIATVYRKERELFLNTSTQKLNDDKRILLSKQSRLKDKALFIKKRIALLQKYLSESEAIKQTANKNLNTDDKVWALLKINNDLQVSRERLSSLEEQLKIDLEEENEVLENALAENIRLQSEQDSKLNIIRLKLDKLLDTRALSEPMKSINPVGKSKTVIILLSLVVGVFVSIMIVMIAEFVSKVREQA